MGKAEEWHPISGYGKRMLTNELQGFFEIGRILLDYPNEPFYTLIFKIRNDDLNLNE